jgi:hypothetical protein
LDSTRTPRSVGEIDVIAFLEHALDVAAVFSVGYSSTAARIFLPPPQDRVG